MRNGQRGGANNHGRGPVSWSRVNARKLMTLTAIIKAIALATGTYLGSFLMVDCPVLNSQQSIPTHVCTHTVLKLKWMATISLSRSEKMMTPEEVGHDHV
jgi:hypothetical protein